MSAPKVASKKMMKSKQPEEEQKIPLTINERPPQKKSKGRMVMVQTSDK